MVLPPSHRSPPKGMGAVVLYVPLEVILDKSVIEMQADLGLPWFDPHEEPVWLQ